MDEDNKETVRMEKVKKAYFSQQFSTLFFLMRAFLQEQKPWFWQKI